MSDLEHT